MNTQQKNINTKSNRTGLLLAGTVIDRTRRYVPKDKPTTQIVTYLIETNTEAKYYVDEFSPQSYYDVGSDVCLPVYIKTFKRKNGEPSYTLQIQQQASTRGERF